MLPLLPRQPLVESLSDGIYSPQGVLQKAEGYLSKVNLSSESGKRVFDPFRLQFVEPNKWGDDTRQRVLLEAKVGAKTAARQASKAAQKIQTRARAAKHMAEANQGAVLIAKEAAVCAKHHSINASLATQLSVKK